MSRRASGAVLAVLLLVLPAAPAAAITYGEPDGSTHPNVGAIVAIDYPGKPHLAIGCSGTLIAANVLLTAGHCTAGVQWSIENGIVRLVTFDPVVSEASTFYAIAAVHTHPAYTGYFGQFGKYGASDPADVGVLILAEAPTGITPAALPSGGMLDELKQAQGLDETAFTAVGYGGVRATNRFGFAGIVDNLERNRVDQSFMSLTDAWLRLSQNSATGDGGTCYGDSGGPHFIHVDGVETDIVAAVTGWGDAPCIASEWDYRIDTESALDFLAEYLD